VFSGVYCHNRFIDDILRDAYAFHFHAKNSRYGAGFCCSVVAQNATEITAVWNGSDRWETGENNDIKYRE